MQGCAHQILVGIISDALYRDADTHRAVHKRRVQIGFEAQKQAIAKLESVEMNSGETLGVVTIRLDEFLSQEWRDVDHLGILCG